MTTVEQFRQCLGIISHTRAGWDYELTPAQAEKERREETDALDKARVIWAENPAMHDELRHAFVAVSPLATMNEIERAAVAK